MKTDGLFDFRVVEVPFQRYGEEISLYPISDIHFGSPNFAAERWGKFLDEVKKDKRPKLFIFLGDIFDALSTSERRFVLAGGMHDTTILRWEKDYAKDVKDFLKQVAPIAANRTLAVFGGNHYYSFHDGTTSDMAVAAGLNAPYIGTAGYVVLILKDKNNHGHEVKIFCHHGTSDSRMKQARANFRCDLLLMGHNHQTYNIPQAEIDCISGQGGKYRIVEHVTRLVRCGSFLKSYEAGLKSYPVDSLMSPSMLGCPRVSIIPMRKQINKGKNCPDKYVDDRWVEIKATI